MSDKKITALTEKELFGEKLPALPKAEEATFVNTILGRGVTDGVVNLTLGVLNFTPTKEMQIDPDPVIVSRLRMSTSTARDLYTVLGEIFDVPAESAPAASPAEGIASNKLN